MFKKMKSFLAESEKESTERGSGFVNSLDIDKIELSLKQGMLVPVLIEVDGELLAEAKYVGLDGMYKLTIDHTNLTIMENKEKDSKKLTIPLASECHVDISFVKKFSLEWGLPHVHVYTVISVHSGSDVYNFVWSGYPKTHTLLDYFIKNNIDYHVEEATAKILAEELSEEDLKREIEQNDKIETISNAKLVSI